MPLLAGTRIGPYEIVSPLGSGGMGEVYRATDSKLRRDVALKVLPDAVAADPDRLARFRREAQVLAALNHPHIAHVYGFEDAPALPGAGTHALVMELVEGPTLADLIARGHALPIDQTIAIARQLADAIETAHELGIVHRDLKPANIKVRDDGAVKVLDFGLAKAMEAPGAASADAMNSPTITARGTEVGLILGTAAYMAPEQARGRPVDRRADIWAFGVVLYEMLTAARAFTGDDVSETLASVLKSTPDFSALPAVTPHGLRRLIERCLVRDPKQRLRDMGDARIALDEIARGADSPAPNTGAATAAPARRWPFALAGGAALVATTVAGSLAWSLLHAPVARPTTVTRATLPVPKAPAFPTLSRDGSRFAYSSLDTTGKAELRLRIIDQLDDRPVPGAGAGIFPVFSPDGSWIAFNSMDGSSAIRKIPVTGGTPTTLAAGPFIFQDGAAWGDDDTIVFSGRSGLMRVSANGGTPQALTTVDATKGETAHVRPQFLPGGRQLLFTIVASGRKSPKMFAVLDLETGRYRAVAPGGDNGHYTPDGFLTFLRQSTVFAVPFDLARLVAIGPEVPVIESVSVVTPLGADYAFSDTGVLVYFRATSDDSSTLAWADRKGATTALKGDARRNWGTVRLSPDGTRIAGNIRDDKGGSDIWFLDIARSTTTRLTFGGDGGGVSNSPIWSPDGRRIVYGAAIEGQFGIWSVAADGSSPPARLFATDRIPRPTSFAPDGASLIYEDLATRDFRRLVVVVHPFDEATRSSHLLQDNETRSEYEGQISPDGHWIAYESGDSTGSEIYVQPYPGPGARIHVSPHGGFRPRWNPNSQELLYSSANSQLVTSAAIAATPAGFSVGAVRQLFHLATGRLLDVAPDDRFLVDLDPPEVPAAAGTCVLVTNWFEELERLARPKTK